MTLGRPPLSVNLLVDGSARTTVNHLPVSGDKQSVMVIQERCKGPRRLCDDDDDHSMNEQEAQLPLRNRASEMHFFVAKLLALAIMTYSYVCHLRNLRTSKFVMHTGNKLQHVTAAVV